VNVEEVRARLENMDLPARITLSDLPSQNPHLFLWLYIDDQDARYATDVCFKIDGSASFAPRVSLAFLSPDMLDFFAYVSRMFRDEV